VTGALIAAGLAVAALAMTIPALRRRRPASPRRTRRQPLPRTRRAPRWRARSARRRLAQVVPPPAPARGRRIDLIRLAAGLAGVLIALLLSGWPGVLAGLAGAVAIDRGLRRLEPAGRRRERRLAEAAELPLAADLLAVTLRGGAPVDGATAAVAEALPGPLGDRLARVARMLRLGSTPAEAWAELTTVDDPLPGAVRLVRAAVRSAEHGSAFARALERLADDLRADRTIATEAAARRAAVLIVLPLGLCFLPAFILAGLVPVIIAILGDVL
jgi:Flp pilus assembly protein TadB